MPIESFSLQGWEVLQVEEGDTAYRLTLTHTVTEPMVVGLVKTEIDQI